MSDFGAIIYIKRRDGDEFTDEQFLWIKETCSRYSEECDLKSSLGTPYSFLVGKTTSIDGSVKTVNLLLSEGAGDRDDFEWQQEVDEKDAKRIASELEARLPNYDLTPSFEWW